VSAGDCSQPALGAFERKFSLEYELHRAHRMARLVGWTRDQIIHQTMETGRERISIEEVQLAALAEVLRSIEQLETQAR
jgi:hypothetical protein